MSFFSGITSQNNTQTITSYQTATNGTVSEEPSMSFRTGDTIQGKVLDVDGSKVTLAMPNGETLSASLEGDINLTPGQLVAFTTRNGNSGQLVLSPLFTNLNQSMMASTALNNAGIAETPRTLEMTSAMMRSGMSIAKDALQSMNRTLLANPEASPTTVVSMKNFEIPVDEANISRFEAYKNYENQMTDGMKQVVNDLPSAISDLIHSGNEQGAANLLGEVLHIINENADHLPSEMDGFIKTNPDGSFVSEAAHENHETEIPGALRNADIMGDVIKNLTDESVFLKGQTALEPGQGISYDGKGTESLQLDGQLNKMLEQEINLAVKAETSKITDNPFMDTQDPWKALPEENRNSILHLLKETGVESGFIEELEKGQAGTKEFFAQIENILHKEGLTPKMKELFDHKDMRELLKDTLMTEWTLRPSEVAEKGTVEELYQKLHKQVATLTDTLNASAPEASALKTDLSNMSGNMDFMNQMNQTFQYIQIPLKMNGSEATGDLYVYTNKKHLAENDGNVSALLHLDMNHLGPLDVYASITPGNQVFTKFYVADDSILDFIEGHLPELTERLTQRGYQVKAESIIKGTEEKEPQMFDATSLGSDSMVPVNKLSFDIRA